MLEYSEAVNKVLQNIHSLSPVEQPLQDLYSGQCLAETVHADFDLPAIATATMDGFACAYSSLKLKTPLNIVDAILAGQRSNQVINAGETVRIMTGAPLPKGCDTVVPQENTKQEDNKIVITTAPGLGAYVRLCGEDFRCGDQLLAAGTTLDPGAAGLLAAAGISRIKVYPRPKVAILSTGDELIALGSTPQSGKIVNSNAYTLMMRLREEGCEPVSLGIVDDRLDCLTQCLRQGLSANLLITTGGSSDGDRDLVKTALDKLGFSTVFSKVAIRPGKSLLFGTIGSLPVFGLPGNPSASAVTFELFVRPALRRLAGCRNPHAPRIKVLLAANIAGGKEHSQFLWGQLKIVAGKFHFYPAKYTSQLYDPCGAHALLPVAAGSKILSAGSEVDVIFLRIPEESSLS